jgi:tRNA A-37 threonylcarbamoyl transferase component Bud32/membrane-associated phospholipid phosphatase
MTHSRTEQEIGQSRETGNEPQAPDVATTKKRRRPSGEPPPLPGQLRSTGRALVAALGAIFLFLVLLATIGNLGTNLTRGELSILRRVVDLRSDPMTDVMRAVDALGSDWTIGILRWSTVVALIVLKRFRHLFVFIGSVLAVGAITTILSLTVTRERPMGIDIIGHWEGGPFPSRPVAILAVTLIGITYSLVVPGRARTIAKWVSATLILLLGAAELYLGTFHPIDVMVGAIIGAAIPVAAFRLITPNEVFPVSYRRGRAAHLDVGGARGEAIRQALEHQLGILVLEAKPFGLAGSGGSTPLRLRVAGDPEAILFAKLYAKNHLRADRWYKLGRTLLYGRLEDEASFSTVRRLIQYEDYMLRVMEDAGIPSPTPYGIAEITPEREYLLVTEFLVGGKELLEVEVDDEIIDSALGVLRQLWDAGLAHRDVKPSNILVRDKKVHLIDVAFAQIRPSPWRQAVDLANMMLALALRTDAERVYERALHFFTPDEISEAFAATRAVTMPSQSRRLVRKSDRDLVAAFRKLAPQRPPISIQRWSWRRVMLTLGVLLACFIGLLFAVGNLQGAGLLSDPEAAKASFAELQRPECGNLEEYGTTFILEAQSVPSASLLPCISALPLGWSFGGLEVKDGEARLIFHSDREGMEAVTVTLTDGCDVSGATEVPTDEPGTQRFERISRLDDSYSGVRYYVFEGGCAAYRFDFSGETPTALAEEITSAVSFESRAEGEELLLEETGIEL